MKLCARSTVRCVRKRPPGKARSLKGATKLSSQPFTTQTVPQPAATVVPGRDLVSIRDLSPIELESIFHLASMMKARPEDFRTALAGKHIAMFFEKPSLRTRLTFEAGICGLGGSVSFVDQRPKRLAARGTLPCICHNLERWGSA